VNEWPVWGSLPHRRNSSAAVAKGLCVSESCTCTRPVCPAQQTLMVTAANGSCEPTMTDAANSADGGNAPVADLNA